MIPKSYLTILDKLQQQGETIMHIDNVNIQIPKNNLLSALKYLHAVGDIVLLPEGLICIRPSEISQLMAQFISPENVQSSLPHIASGNIEILTSDQVGRLLCLKNNDPMYVTVFWILT